ncbi:MAG: hypothetical protein Q8R86_04620 [Sulfuricurvum sp.]|nr:hypothetical protein [Sulfuricurvum sp.]
MSAVTLMVLICTTVAAVMVLAAMEVVSEGMVMMTKAKRIAGVLLLIDVIVFGSGALYALVMNTYGG